MEREKKNTEPGWNDPPIFSYTESTGHVKSPKRNLLNKRVAYPLSGCVKNNVSTSITHLISDLPPPPPSAALAVMSESSLPSEFVANIKENQCKLENCTSSTINIVTSDRMLQEVLMNMNQIMKDKDQLLQNQNKNEQIRKKIHIMEETWKSKLTDDIKEKVLHLSTAMKEQDKNKANEIQASLMVDYPKLCSEFISAFRMLINAE